MSESNKKMIVAITGQTGCGKSTLSAFYKSKGYTVIDCDRVAEKIREIPRCQKELSEYFGDEILTEGKIDTRYLYAKAFLTKENLQALTNITHPYIVREILKQSDECFKNGEEVVFVDGAVIVGHIFEKYCDKFIVVVSDINKQCQRLIKRDNITEERAKIRISKQTPYSDMLKKADYVINNNTGVDSLILQGEFVIRQLMNK